METFWIEELFHVEYQDIAPERVQNEIEWSARDEIRKGGGSKKYDKNETG